MEIMLNEKESDNIIYMPDPAVAPDPRGIGYEYFHAMLRYPERVAQVDGHTNEE